MKYFTITEYYLGFSVLFLTTPVLKSVTSGIEMDSSFGRQDWLTDLRSDITISPYFWCVTNDIFFFFSIYICLHLITLIINLHRLKRCRSTVYKICIYIFPSPAGTIKMKHVFSLHIVDILEGRHRGVSLFFTII